MQKQYHKTSRSNHYNRGKYNVYYKPNQTRKQLRLFFRLYYTHVNIQQGSRYASMSEKKEISITAMMPKQNSVCLSTVSNRNKQTTLSNPYVIANIKHLSKPWRLLKPDLEDALIAYPERPHDQPVPRQILQQDLRLFNVNNHFEYIRTWRNFLIYESAWYLWPVLRVEPAHIFYAACDAAC
jgi:hypothetical protein